MQTIIAALQGIRTARFNYSSPRGYRQTNRVCEPIYTVM